MEDSLLWNLYYQEAQIFKKPVPMAVQSKARTVFNRSNTGITGSNPAQGIDVFPRFSVLCCPV